ncbi:MAG: hypothetical protein HY255_05305 [Betaproteobacteria bacterium]|nr:hypothetical protein [Betaproteobacteria bacterium]
MKKKTVFLLLNDPDNARFWANALASQDLHGAELRAPPGEMIHALKADIRVDGASAVIADLPRLIAEGVDAAKLARWLADRHAGMVLFVRLPQRILVSQQEQAWARGNDIAGVLGGVSTASLADTLLPSLSRVARVLGSADARHESLEQYLRVLNVAPVEDEDAALSQTFAALRSLHMSVAEAAELARRMRDFNGVPSTDRNYRGKTYRGCFIASDAVAWLMARRRMTRPQAVAAGIAMQGLGLIHHSVREQVFQDGFYYFRFDGDAETLDAIDLSNVVEEMRGNNPVPIDNRTWLGKTYPNCLIGSEAVDWLCARYRLGIGEAECIGQRLIDLGILHHVTDDHGFTDANLYYRFYRDEN